MATVTLTGNTNYSALSLANDDTIALAGYILTLDIQPTHTGIQVISPGTAGRVDFSGPWVIPTWDFFAGTPSFSVGMITTLPEGAEIGSITGGTSSNARGMVTNNGTIGTATGGSGSSSHGVNTNNGAVAIAIGGTGTSSAGIDTNNNYVGTATGSNGTSRHGVGTNNGRVGTATGGSSSAAYGVASNAVDGIIENAVGGSVNLAAGVNANGGLVQTATGGSVSGADGVRSNSQGTVIKAVGGPVSGSFGIGSNSAQKLCLQLEDNTGKAVDSWAGSSCVVDGPNIKGTIPDNIKTIYSVGALSEDAIIAGDATVITLPSGGGSSGPSRIRQGNLIGRSF